jgi:hypothetical protein
LKNPLQTQGLLPGILASAVLAIGTLYIFYRLNATGPVATLRLFHVAIQDHDEKLLDRVSNRESDPLTDRLIASIQGLLSKGEQFRVVESQVQTDHVIMQVTYTLGSQVTPMFFVLDREGRNWRINGTSSIQTFQRAMRIPTAP